MPCILFLQFAMNHYRTHSKVNANVFLSWLPAIVSSLFLKGRMSFKKAKCCQQYFLLKSLLVLFGRHDRVQNNDWFKLTQQKNRESPPKKSSVTYNTHRITRYDLKLIIYFSDILYSHVKSFLNIREQKWSLNISLTVERNVWSSLEQWIWGNYSVQFFKMWIFYYSVFHSQLLRVEAEFKED